VIKGHGIGILPSCYVQTHFPQSLHRITKTPYIRNNICLTYRSENKEVTSIQTIIKTLKDNFHGH